MSSAQSPASLPPLVSLSLAVCVPSSHLTSEPVASLWPRSGVSGDALGTVPSIVVVMTT